MKLRPLVIVGVVLILAMLAVSAWAWPQIPDGAQVPIHWGPSGEPDGYGPKWMGLLGIPAVAAGVLALLVVLPRLEPRRFNLERSSTAYVAVGMAALGLVAALHASAVIGTVTETTSVPLVAILGIGVAFVVIGNFVSKTRSSWFFGIRTPWTLSSERSWAQTHRMGGYGFVGLGVLIVVAALAWGPVVGLWVMLAGIGIGLVALFAYSYLVWRDDPARRDSEVARS
jgi:uncharacterized membrane protein